MATKTCTGCSQTLPLEAFYRSRLGAQGYGSRCKACNATVSRARYARCRSEILKQTRCYRAANIGTLREKERTKRRRSDVSARLAADQRRRRAAEPEKTRARKAVQNALRRGQLTKPPACQSCERTDAPRLIAHHHRGYAREHWLDVEWICDSCHQRHHSQERAA
jgi:hypothetical protein